MCRSLLICTNAGLMSAEPSWAVKASREMRSAIYTFCKYGQLSGSSGWSEGCGTSGMPCRSNFKSDLISCSPSLAFSMVKSCMLELLWEYDPVKKWSRDVELWWQNELDSKLQPRS